MFKFHNVKSLQILITLLASIAIMVGSEKLQANPFFSVTGELYGHNVHPYESFAKINIDASVRMLLCESGDCPEGPIIIPVGSFSMTGSGAVIGSDGRHTYVITAAHVCEPQNFMPHMREMAANGYDIDASLTITSFFGDQYEAEVVGVSMMDDLCLMRTEEVWANPVPLATEMPEIGSVVYNVAAPRGIFGPGMVPLFDGYYSGDGYGSEVYFTIPLAPGSSGSMVLNEDGEIIAIIHSSLRGFDNVGIGSDIESIWRLIHSSNIPAGTIY